MQFSKFTADHARNFNIDPRDVLFCLLYCSGASVAESYAVVYRPKTTTATGLQAAARKLMNLKPGINALIAELNSKHADSVTPDTSGRRRGRPRKDIDASAALAIRDTFDYTDKDAVLRELVKEAEITSGSERARILMQVAELQKMKAEQAKGDEKRVQFYVPLSFPQCAELLELLQKEHKKGPGILLPGPFSVLLQGSALQLLDGGLYTAD